MRTLQVIMLLVLSGTLVTGCAEQVSMGPDVPNYMIEYNDAAALDYNIAWQSRTAVMRWGEATRVLPMGEYVLASEDGSNVISGLTARDGKPLWEEPVGDRLEHLQGMVPFGKTQIIAATQSDCYYIDVATGRLVTQQGFIEQDIATTTPVIMNPYALYGTDDGRLIFHHIPTGLKRMAYRFSAGIDMPPYFLSDGTTAVIVTRTGRIHLHDCANNSQYWMGGVLDPIIATPVANEDLVFIAGTDQSVWAFRISDGKRVWRTRFENILYDDPKLVGEVLYQAVPDQGLAALDVTTGKVIWINPEVKGGTVVATRDGDLIIWDRDDAPDATGSTLYRLDPELGDILGQATCPRIHELVADGFDDAALYGLSRKGRLIKLVP